jgi:heme/copper-type cytochrome/quinol oxidase subunit 2
MQAEARRTNSMAIIIRVLLSLLLTIGVLSPHLRAAETPRVIRLIADKDNRFRLPDQSTQILKLKAGEDVLLRVTAYPGTERARDGSVHSLVIRSLRDQGWDVRLKEGAQDIRLTAPAKPGQYLIECTVKCGPGHDDMNLKVVVEK